jgi:hypothetical protein
MKEQVGSNSGRTPEVGARGVRWLIALLSFDPKRNAGETTASDDK